MRKDPIPGSLGEALEIAECRFMEGDLEGARTAASRAVTISPESATARHFLAAALMELGDFDGADRQFHEALALAPDDPEILLGVCCLLLNHSTDIDGFEEVLEIAERGRHLSAEAGNTDLETEFLLAGANALIWLGSAKKAVLLLCRAGELSPDHPEINLQLGMAYFDLVRISDARESLLRALSSDPENPLAHWYMGLIAERKGDREEAQRRFRRASRIDEINFPLTPTLTDEEFDQAVREALSGLPEPVKEHMNNVAVICDTIPEDNDLLDSEPPLSPDILGLFRGSILRDSRSPASCAELPASIILYRKNIERTCRTKEETVRQIEKTVLHEVGHYLGWDEDDLVEMGLG